MYSFAMQSQRDSAQVIHSNARSSENNRELMEQWVMCLLLTYHIVMVTMFVLDIVTI